MIIVAGIQYWDLVSIFAPKYDTPNLDECGHWLIPYDYIDQIRVLDRNGVMVSDYHIKFATSNFDKTYLLEENNAQRSEATGI